MIFIRSYNFLTVPSCNLWRIIRSCNFRSSNFLGKLFKIRSYHPLPFSKDWPSNLLSNITLQELSDQHIIYKIKCGIIATYYYIYSSRFSRITYVYHAFAISKHEKMSWFRSFIAHLLARSFFKYQNRRG